MQYYPSISTSNVRGYLSEARFNPAPKPDRNRHKVSSLEAMDLEGLLMSCISKMPISPDFLNALGISKGVSNNFITPRYSKRHGELVKLAFNRIAQHEAILRRDTLVEILTLPTDSLYQFYEDNYKVVEKLFTELGCKYLVAHRLENAVSANLAEKMREYLDPESQADALEQNKRAIQYGKSLYKKFSHIPFSNEVRCILERLNIVSEYDRSPTLRELAKESFRHSVGMLRHVFNQDLRLIAPITESYENFCREAPQTLETVYLFPWKYEDYIRDKQNGICIETRRGRFEFYDSFRSVLEAQIAKSCPNVSTEVAVACIQEAARNSLYDWHKSRGGKLLARSAVFLLHAAKTATFLAP